MQTQAPVDDLRGPVPAERPLKPPRVQPRPGAPSKGARQIARDLDPPAEAWASGPQIGPHGGQQGLQFTVSDQFRLWAHGDDARLAPDLLTKEVGVNLPKRMPVWVSAKTDPIRAHWLTALAVSNGLSGGICVLLPAGEASQTLLYVSGGLLLASAVLVAGGWSVTGGAAGAFGWGLLVAIVLFAIVEWTALWCLAPVVLGGEAIRHALIVYEVGSRLDRDRERRQRR